jgi:hypothetical protein
LNTAQKPICGLLLALFWFWAVFHAFVVCHGETTNFVH